MLWCNTITKSNFYITAPYWKNSGKEFEQGRNLKAGKDAKIIEECSLLTCLPWLALPVFFIEPRTTTQGVAPPIMDWAFSINLYFRKCQQDYLQPYGPSGGSQSRLPLLWSLHQVGTKQASTKTFYQTV